MPRSFLLARRSPCKLIVRSIFPEVSETTKKLRLKFRKIPFTFSLLLRDVRTLIGEISFARSVQSEGKRIPIRVKWRRKFHWRKVEEEIPLAQSRGENSNAVEISDREERERSSIIFHLSAIRDRERVDL